MSRPYREGVVGRPFSVSPLSARTQADRDLVRFTGITRYAPLLPLSDTFFDGRSLGDSGVRFGGAHRGFVQMAYADSSVRTTSFDVDLDVHQQLGNRKDGLPVPSQ